MCSGERSVIRCMVSHDKNVHRKSRSKGARLTSDWHRVIAGSSVPCLRIKTLSQVGASQATKPAVFCTGSSYQGNYDRLGFAGFGMYRYPHGVTYEGYFKNGKFHGEGSITYPNGQILDGGWVHGRLAKYTFRCNDGLEYCDPFTYLVMPDRRYHNEIEARRFQPAPNERVDNETVYIPKHCYSTGDGYYNPATKRVYNKNGEVLRIVTKKEEETIRNKFMVNSDRNIGYKPELYEYWNTGEHDHVLQIHRDYAGRKRGITKLSKEPIVVAPSILLRSRESSLFCIQGLIAS